MMPEPAGPGMVDRLAGPLDYEGLAEYLSALAYPVRLELLDVLRFPHALGEIRLQPRRGKALGTATRPASRQAIHAHLGKLVDADLVRTDEGLLDGRMQVRYSVNPPRLYALTEELRRLSVIHAGRGPAGDATGTLWERDHPDAVRGPRLVLVHGVYEGKAFPLDASTAQDGRWTIGRRRGLGVALDYDPYVSLENAVVTERQGRFTLTDLPASKNGTFVNWALLPRGGSRELKAGDVIGVGRSRLCFVAE